MLERFSVHITAFGEDRGITVYTPKNYREEQTAYPVLYMHDGQNVFRDEGAFGGVSLRLVEYLEKEGLAVIVVAIDLHPEERRNEYCPWPNGTYSTTLRKDLQTGIFGGNGKQYVDWLAGELKPYIDATYRTLPHAAAIAGISLGGLISVYAACRYPHMFPHIAALSSGFYANQEEIEQFICESDLSSLQSLYMDCGTCESGDRDVAEGFLKTNIAVANILHSKVQHMTFQTIEQGTHDYHCFQKRVPALFTFLDIHNKQQNGK